MTTRTVLTDEQINKAWRNNLKGFVMSGDQVRKFARDIEQSVLQSQEIQAWKRDSELLSAIESECWDIRYGSTPNADAGDATTSIEIVGHFMGKPNERIIGEDYNESLRAALEQAMTADAYPPARPEYGDDVAMEQKQ